MVKFDDENKVARVSLRATELMAILNKKEAEDPTGKKVFWSRHWKQINYCNCNYWLFLGVKSLWRPEFGNYMVEGTPGKPYGGLLAHFNVVEANMRYRRQEVTELLQPDEIVMSLTNFPRLGAPKCTWPIFDPNPSDVNSAARSLYLPDEVICQGHPRFKTLARNIRQRRGKNVDIRLTVFKDEKTQIPVEGAPADQPDAVQMDAMAFGMGCCCLQLTFQVSIERFTLFSINFRGITLINTNKSVFSFVRLAI